MSLKSKKTKEKIMKTDNFKIIATAYTDFPEKFGIPRQSGIISGLMGKIVFEPEFRDCTALRGLEGYSHIWLLWKFSANEKKAWSPTVRPPRLGGNKRIGVFATRSPFRPNPIGLSCVKLESIAKTEDFGTVLTVSGLDLLNGTPIYDIKPYIPYTDSRPDAIGGFSTAVYENRLKVYIPPELADLLPKPTFKNLYEVLQNDPRPAYQSDPARIYSFEFAGHNIKFRVENDNLTVISISQTVDI